MNIICIKVALYQITSSTPPPPSTPPPCPDRTQLAHGLLLLFKLSLSMSERVSMKRVVTVTYQGSETVCCTRQLLQQTVKTFCQEIKKSLWTYF